MADEASGGAAESLSARVDDWRVVAPLGLPPILESALEEFRTHGENKQGVLVALLECAMGEVLQRARLADTEAEGRALERFSNVVESVVLHMTHRAVLAGLDSELRCLDPANRKRYAALRKDLEELLLGILEEGVAQGLLEVDSATDTTRALLGMCQAVAGWYHDGGPLTPEELADRHAAISLRTVGARVRPVPRERGA